MEGSGEFPAKAMAIRVDAAATSELNRLSMRTLTFLRRFVLLALVIAGSGLTSCESVDPKIKQARDAAIRMEPRGDYYVGRRYYTWRCRYWGYLRRPGSLWETAKLAIINERNCKQPDRLPEAPDAGLAHGHDHNTEYRMYGSYTGRTIYDPNADLMLPEFLLSRWEPISQAPGFLFDPREKYNPRTLPPRETSGRGY